MSTTPLTTSPEKLRARVRENVPMPKIVVQYPGSNEATVCKTRDDYYELYEELCERLRIKNTRERAPLSKSENLIVRTVRDNPGLTMAEIAARLGYSRQALYYPVRCLVTAGYLIVIKGSNGLRGKQPAVYYLAGERSKGTLS